ncbi:MAG: helix-turn-helix domain-containing protein [Flavobacteriales bacterium]|nr:helix-turn-helix domain-containing protein [Flavobacteriales bacterium]
MRHRAAGCGSNACVAKLLLSAGDLQVSEVAFQCGFENLSHFSKAFKEEFGHSPMELKRSIAR